MGWLQLLGIKKDDPIIYSNCWEGYQKWQPLTVDYSKYPIASQIPCPGFKNQPMVVFCSPSGRTCRNCASLSQDCGYPNDVERTK